MSSISQSIELNNFSPVTALTPATSQWCVVISSNFKICNTKYDNKPFFSSKLSNEPL